MKQNKNNENFNTVNLIKFNASNDLNYNIKVAYNFDEVNNFLILNYYFVGDYEQINFNDNLLFENTYKNRQDNLWQHTCCELFIKNNFSNYYREFNFSFNGAWACYDFIDYRQNADEANPKFNNNIYPKIHIRETENTKILQVKIPFKMLLSNVDSANCFNNLILHFCVVVKQNSNNNLYYFADKHLDNSKADFHKF